MNNAYEEKIQLKDIYTEAHSTNRKGAFLSW